MIELAPQTDDADVLPTDQLYTWHVNCSTFFISADLVVECLVDHYVRGVAIEPVPQLFVVFVRSYLSLTPLVCLFVLVRPACRSTWVEGYYHVSLLLLDFSKTLAPIKGLLCLRLH